MQIVLRPLKLYLRYMNTVLDRCTLEDARNMLILGILLLLAGLFDLCNKLPY